MWLFTVTPEMLELVGDLGIGATLGYQRQHIELTRGKCGHRFRARGVGRLALGAQHTSGDGWVEVAVASGHRGDGPDQFFGGEVSGFSRAVQGLGA
jgi:hypothetical protein